MNRIAKTDVTAQNDIPAVISENLAMPLYHQAYLVLRDNIRNGVYGPNRAVPTESELCASFGVSRITIKRAMRMLTDDGLIIRHRGRGTFVVDKIPLEARRDSLDDLLQSVKAIGATTDMRRLDAGVIPAPSDVAAKLRCTPGQPVFMTSQLRLSGGIPIAWIKAYVPADIAARLPEAQTSTLPMLMQLQRAGIPVGKADQSIAASLADPVAASHLGVNVGAPVLNLSRCVFDDSGRPVEWLVALYCGERYEYRTSLARENLGGRSRWETAH